MAEQLPTPTPPEPAHTHEDVAGGGYDRRCLGCVYADGFQAGWLASARSRLQSVTKRSNYERLNGVDAIRDSS